MEINEKKCAHSYESICVLRSICKKSWNEIHLYDTLVGIDISFLFFTAQNEISVLFFLKYILIWYLFVWINISWRSICCKQKRKMLGIHKFDNGCYMAMRNALLDIPSYCNNPIFLYLHISATYCSRDEKRIQMLTSCARLHLREYPTVLHLKCYKRHMIFY